MEDPLSFPDSQYSQPATQVAAIDDNDASGKPHLWGSLLPVKGGFGPFRFDYDTKRATFGRSSRSDCLINDMHVSNRHFQLTLHIPDQPVRSTDYTVFVTDLGSRNGTFVNGEELEKSKQRALQHFDKISLGNHDTAVEFAFYKEAEANEQSNLAVFKKYNFLHKIGCGGYGEVYLAENKSTAERVAIKKIAKKKFSIIGFRLSTVQKREVEIMRAMQHPCIVQLKDFFEEQDALYLVLEFADGGELFDLVNEKNEKHETIPESEVQFLFYQIFHAVKYLHGRNIIHRDLKPENILMANVNNTKIIKVTDFGLSNMVEVDRHRDTVCGTPRYQAPEMLQQYRCPYGKEVDMWSLGVILFICLSGCMPFDEDAAWHNFTLEEQVLKGEFRFDDEAWSSVSSDAKDLIKKLLTVDQKQRCNIDQALEHPWLNGATTQREAAQALIDTQARLQNHKRKHE
eukprot:m.207251 g.207251  ORF g.207251 m.207251 type:complete len:457 (+) comp18923_c0_seq2:195-1565(+)